MLELELVHVRMRLEQRFISDSQNTSKVMDEKTRQAISLTKV